MPHFHHDAYTRRASRASGDGSLSTTRSVTNRCIYGAAHAPRLVRKGRHLGRAARGRRARRHGRAPQGVRRVRVGQALGRGVGRARRAVGRGARARLRRLRRAERRRRPQRRRQRGGRRRRDVPLRVPRLRLGRRLDAHARGGRRRVDGRARAAAARRHVRRAARRPDRLRHEDARQPAPRRAAARRRARRAAPRRLRVAVTFLPGEEHTPPILRSSRHARAPRRASARRFVTPRRGEEGSTNPEAPPHVFVVVSTQARSPCRGSTRSSARPTRPRASSSTFTTSGGCGSTRACSTASSSSTRTAPRAVTRPSPSSCRRVVSRAVLCVLITPRRSKKSRPASRVSPRRPT